MKLLDCTLRDGSYSVDFGFTGDDTLEISRRLDLIGFDYIEVGHGIGLGAQDKGFGIAGATDLEYMTHAYGRRWGMFAIPGIASIGDVEALAINGGSFIRVGCNVDNVSASNEFICKAKQFGLYVFSNIMKSYALNPSEFAKKASELYDYGADCVYVVDSAGSMLPGQVAEYVSSVKALFSGEVGFHGHNNLGLGVANALTALEYGCSVVDVTLCGIGRGGGNVPSEQLIGALRSEYFDYSYLPDLMKVLDAGEEFIKPIGVVGFPTQLDIVSGVASFHSSYMPMVLAIAKAHRIDARALIVKLSSIDVVNLTEDMVDIAAKKISAHCKMMRTSNYFGEEHEV